MLPSAALRGRVILEPYLGEGATGPTYGPQEGVRARIEYGRRVVRRVNAGPDVGADIVASVRVITRPRRVRPETKATIPAAHSTTGADETYQVLAVQDGQGLGRPAYTELMLG